MSIRIVDNLVEWFKGTSTRTRLLLIVSVGTIIIMLLNSTFGLGGNTVYRGEVWGDLEVDGEIEKNEHFGEVYLSGTTYNTRGEDGRFRMNVPNVQSVTVFTHPEQEATTTYHSHQVQGGSFTVEINGGSLRAVLSDANITFRYSEYSGHAISSNGMWSDPEYETSETIGGIRGTADLHPTREVRITKAWIDLGSESIEVVDGGFSVSGRPMMGVSFESEGYWDSDLSPTSYVQSDNPYLVDGTITIENFATEDANGIKGRYYERFKVSGDDVQILTVTGPSSFEHWSYNLIPWVIEIRVDDPDSVRGFSPMRASIITLLFLLAVFILYSDRKRKRQTLPRVVPAGMAVDASGQRDVGVAFHGGAQSMIHRKAKHTRGWMLDGGGLLILIRGIMFLIIGLPSLAYYTNAYAVLALILFPILSIIGGISAIKHRSYGLALMGAIAAILGPGFFPMGPIAVPVFWSGLISLVLFRLGRSEFDTFRETIVGVGNGPYSIDSEHPGQL